MDTPFSLRVNGRVHAVTTDPQRPLLEVLREDLNLTGSKLGCGEGQCGACTVLLDGKRQHSCLLPVAEAAGKAITTVEGLGLGEALHPVQEAFLEERAMQCGFCTSGMIVSAVALLAEKPSATDAEILEWMNTQICRCCGYPRILQAVRKVRDAGRK